jgi:hypothetical protein
MPNSNYEAADAGEGSSSSKDEIVEGLNKDLARVQGNYPICGL